MTDNADNIVWKFPPKGKDGFTFKQFLARLSTTHKTIGVRLRDWDLWKLELILDGRRKYRYCIQNARYFLRDFVEKGRGEEIFPIHFRGYDTCDDFSGALTDIRSDEPFYKVKAFGYSKERKTISFQLGEIYERENKQTPSDLL